MSVQLSVIETLVRQRLDEPVPQYWSSQELTDIIIAGIRDLWRSIVDLKEEHFLFINETDVYLAADGNQFTGVPKDVYKVYLIEDLMDDPANQFVRRYTFMPKDYNHRDFIYARELRGQGSPLPEPYIGTILYAITGQGSPVNAPTIYTAPIVSARINVRFVYVPTIGNLTTDSIVPIPGEVNNALIAWTVAYARAKEREDRAPDPNWISIYATEKANILEGLGLRQLQEGKYVDAMFEEYWS